MDGWIFINDQIIPANEAFISPLDLGVLRGYGVTDYLRTYGGMPFHLEKHLIRFQHSAELIGLEIPKTVNEIKEIINKLVFKAGYKETSIKLVLTGGKSNDQYLPSESPTFFIVAYPFVPFPKKYFEQGIKVITECYARSFFSAKTTHYLPAIVGMKKAQKKGAVDVLFHNDLGYLLETGTANFFGFKAGKFITPKDGILKGITREIIIDILEEYYSFEEREIHKDEIKLLDGAFLTSSNKEIMPVCQIDHHLLTIPKEITNLAKIFSKKLLQNI